MDEGKIRKGGYIAIGTCHTDPATGVVQVYVQSTLDSSNFHLKNTGTNKNLSIFGMVLIFQRVNQK